MRDLSEIHTQVLSDVTTSVRMHLREPENQTFREMAVSLCGSLFTTSVEFPDQCEAFAFCGMNMIEIAKNAESEISKRMGLI